jgi:hypothetical protein
VLGANFQRVLGEIWGTAWARGSYTCGAQTERFRAATLSAAKAGAFANAVNAA